MQIILDPSKLNMLGVIDEKYVIELDPILKKVNVPKLKNKVAIQII